MKKIIALLLVISTNTYSNDAAISMGERMFNDFRFSQYFFKSSNGDVNLKLKVGAPELETMDRLGTEAPSPFSGEAMSCASCHMVDQAFEDSIGMRGYNDFAVRSKIPLRSDGNKLTLRNTPTLVGIGSKYAQNRFSHYDGEFFDHSQTVLGNFTGRNMGWLAGEKKLALKNIVNVIRKDKGQGDLALEFGGSYENVLLAIDPAIDDELRLSAEDRFDVRSATDEEIINKVIYFVTAYMNDIDFEKDENEVYTGSMYDRFLEINNLPRAPIGSQDLFAYNRDLIKNLKSVKEPKFVKVERFENHNKSFGFNELEFKGMKIFFGIQNGNNGMCINCHLAPLFSDQLFHNIGTTQAEYDGIHGHGSFAKLKVPSLTDRAENEFMAKRPTKANTKAVDLGVWNFFGRDNKPELTNYIVNLFCRPQDENCNKEMLLPYMIGRIKTPTLRNLGHSAPYFHNGSAKNLEEVVERYIESSIMTVTKELRNGAPQLRPMNITIQDSAALKAFLNSLNENYE